MANVVITGTSSGFGRLTVDTLAKAGHTVFAAMRGSAGRNAKAAQELSAAGAGKVRVVEMDVTSDAAVEQAIETIARQTEGAIDVLFNNAGRFSAGVQEAFTIEELKSLFEINVFGPFRVTRAVLPHMRKRRGGLIINTSSIVGRISLPCLGTYCASKFALEALADAQRDELKSLGIDVVLIEPGAFPTEVGNKGLYASDPRAQEYGEVAAIPQKMGEGLAQLFASPKAPNPQDVADAVKRLIDMPAGRRPARMVVDKLTGDPVRAVNEVYEKQRLALMTAFGIA
ncbi:MAG TPA: SDR family oxidoreductase [Burkholderiales bacterium]|nr:SDR family oxidoreductase [Burkholderiales bacterium]